MSKLTGAAASFLSALEFRLLEAGLRLLLVLNGTSVFTRYVLNHAVGELFEAMIFISVAIYWLGVATAQRLGGHLGMDFAVSALPAGARRVADLLRLLVIVGFLGAVIYSSILMIMSQFRLGTATSLLGVPVWLFSIFLPIGCALLLWRSIFPPRRSGDEHEAII
jgi:C4-dicarboxylate transporter DctQ subunit